MKALEESVRGIEKEGLVWGASKLVPVGFGIKKLQINLVVEDEKVDLTELEEQIQEFEEYVQSTDIVRLPVPRLTIAHSHWISRPPCRSSKLLQERVEKGSECSRESQYVSGLGDECGKKWDMISLTRQAATLSIGP